VASNAVQYSLLMLMNKNRVIRDTITATTDVVQTVSHVFGSPRWSRTAESSLPGGSVGSAPGNPGGKVYGERMYAFVTCAK
jgi:hypothetical protein